MTASHAGGLRERLRPLPYGHSTVSDHAVMGASAAALSCGWGYAADRLRPEGLPQDQSDGPPPATIAGHVDEGVAL